MKELLAIAQIVIAILLMVFILLQQRGTALGSGFGGGGSEVYSSRRGIQKNLFTATIVAGIIFIALAFLSLVL
ncbi:MAG: preprotein translocase subunit SecG [bacterium]